MTHTYTLTLLLIVALGAVACEPPQPAVDKDGVPCPGLPSHMSPLLERHHPLIFRGTLKALPRATSSHLMDLLIPTAHAYAFEEERPIPDATVRLSYHTQEGELKAHAETTTNARGEFCLVAPRVQRPGEWIVLESRRGDEVFRQLGVHSFDAHINAVSEALTRIALEHDTMLSPSQWLNVRTLADTRVGFIDPVNASEFESQEALIVHIHETLKEDADMMAIFGG